MSSPTDNTPSNDNPDDQPAGAAGDILKGIEVMLTEKLKKDDEDRRSLIRGFEELHTSVSTSVKDLRKEVNEQLQEYGEELERLRNQVTALTALKDFSVALNAMQFSGNPISQSSPQNARRESVNNFSANSSAIQGTSGIQQNVGHQPDANNTTPVNATTTTPSHVKIAPETYDGSKNWSDYILSFEMGADINGWSTELRVKYLAAMLRGPALEVLRNIVPENRNDYAALKSSLNQRFGDEFRRGLHHAQLRSRQQHRTEDITTYSDAVKRLVSSAYHNCPSDVRDLIALNHFIDGLSDPLIQDRVRLANVKKLDEAVQMALQIEYGRNATKSAQKAVRLAAPAITESEQSFGDESSEEEMIAFEARAVGTQTTPFRKKKYYYKTKKQSGNDRSPA